ncbi:hypothetical protein P7K49_026788, partial [Saguinus oedipus]
RRLWRRLELLRSYTSKGSPLSPPPPPTLFPSPGHPARPTPSGEQGKRLADPFFPFSFLPPARSPPRCHRGAGLLGTGGRGRRQHSPRPRVLPPPLRPSGGATRPAVLAPGPPSAGTRAGWARIIA